MNASNPIKPSSHQVATLDTLSESQIATIRALPSHENCAPDPIEARRPASNFLDEDLYKLEQQKIFRRLPVAVTLSAMLREPGSVLAHNGYGVPLVVTRAKDGKVRAFLNACQHKGAMLVEDCEVHKMGRLSCPYHAWTYALDGKLIGVPREETFLNLNKAERNLAELPCQESGGVIWVILDKNAKPDFSLLNSELTGDLDALRIPSAHIYGHRTFDLKANWKLVLEPFLESYHVQRLHASTVGPMFADIPGISVTLGAHIRQTSGKVNFTPDMLDQPGENIHKLITMAYDIFPATVIITSPYYISVMIVMPTGVGTSTIDYYMLTQAPPDNPKAEEIYSRSYELIQKVFGTEDFRAAEISQIGLAAGALDDVVYCGLEHNIPRYQKILDKYLQN